MLRVEQNKHQRVLRVARALRHDVCALLNVSLQDLYVQLEPLVKATGELAIQASCCVLGLVPALLLKDQRWTPCPIHAPQALQAQLPIACFLGLLRASLRTVLD